MPSWSNDLLSRYFGGTVQVRNKPDKPTVGFSGFAPKPSLMSMVWNNTIKEYLNLKGPNMGTLSRIRYDTLNVLNNVSGIQKAFISQERFWGGISDSQKRMEKRREFAKNLIDSDYPLCIRGSGNFSSRFYEALCCGRVPLFIDTDCVLPYDFEIDWKKYCIWVDSKNLSDIGESIMEFHNRVSPQEFIDLQYQCRKIWEQYITPVGFFKNFYKHFSKK
jgi:hypothetical protein